MRSKNMSFAEIRFWLYRNMRFAQITEFFESFEMWFLNMRALNELTSFISVCKNLLKCWKPFDGLIIDR